MGDRFVRLSVSAPIWATYSQATVLRARSLLAGSTSPAASPITALSGSPQLSVPLSLEIVLFEHTPVYKLSMITTLISLNCKLKLSSQTRGIDFFQRVRTQSTPPPLTPGDDTVWVKITAV